MHVCPYCKQEMPEDKPLAARLTPRQFAVYEAVVKAGPEGIGSQDLIDKCLTGRSSVTLRSCIYSINQIINPQRLAGRGGKYTLDRVNWSMEGLSEQSNKVSVGES